MLLSKQPPYPKADMYVVKADIAALKADMSESEVRLIKWMVSLHLATIAFLVAFIKLL